MLELYDVIKGLSSLTSLDFIFFFLKMDYGLLFIAVPLQLLLKGHTSLCYIHE